MSSEDMPAAFSVRVTCREAVSSAEAGEIRAAPPVDGECEGKQYNAKLGFHRYCSFLGAGLIARLGPTMRHTRLRHTVESGSLSHFLPTGPRNQAAVMVTMQPQRWADNDPRHTLNA